MSRVERAIAAERERILLELTDLDARGRENPTAPYRPDDEAYWEHPWCDLAAIVNGASAREVAPWAFPQAGSAAFTSSPAPPLPDLPEVKEVTHALADGSELRVGDRVRAVGMQWGEGTVVELTTSPTRSPVTVERDDGQRGCFLLDQVELVVVETYTLVLIDSDPEHAEDGDFVHVEGVTVDDLGDIDVLVRFREAMRETAS